MAPIRWGPVLGIVLMALAACGDTGAAPAGEGETVEFASGRLRDLGPGVLRVRGGADPTIALSAQVIESSRVVLLGRDDVFADALAAAGAQGRLQAPLLLVHGASLDPEVHEELDRLGARTVYVLGGQSAITDGLVTALRSRGFAARRLGGENRYATAVLAAEHFHPDARGAVLAAGGDDEQPPPEILAAGAIAAARDEPLLLAERAHLPSETRSYLETHGIEKVLLVGGRDTVGAQVADAVRSLGIAVRRVGGTTPAATAAQLAEGVFASAPAPAVVLVDGEDPRAWTTAFPAASLGAPVLLTAGNQLPPETAGALDRAVGQGATVVCSTNVTEVACTRARTVAGSARDG